MLLRSELLNILAVAGADRDDEGEFFVRGGITSFMGMGDEFLIDGTAQYRKGEQWFSILGVAQITSYHRPVQVIM